MKTRAASLYDPDGRRKYLTPDERRRFMVALSSLAPSDALLCRTLIMTGCRLSEALALQRHHISVAEQSVLIRSLKKRDAIVYRRVPIPRELMINLLKFASAGGAEQPIWPMGRTAAWQVVKRAMELAGIDGPQACPRGLRHSFGVHAVQSGVPLHLIQRWLGHARMETTAIYTDVIGNEELLIAGRMWAD